MSDSDSDDVNEQDAKLLLRDQLLNTHERLCKYCVPVFCVT